MPIKELPIFNSYDVQRFKQFSPQDCANWYITQAPSGKKEKAMYPTMGRKHIRRGNQNILNFGIQPRKIFRSIDFLYVVVGATIYQVDVFFNTKIISDATFTRTGGDLRFAYLPCTQTIASVTTQSVFCMLCDGSNIFVINENAVSSSNVFTIVTDANAPKNPLTVAAFGNRFVVASRDSTQFNLAQINMGGNYESGGAGNLFTIPGPTPVLFAQESGIIRQMGVLHNNLFIFTDFTTGIWSNTPSSVTTEFATFPRQESDHPCGYTSGRTLRRSCPRQPSYATRFSFASRLARLCRTRQLRC